MASLIAACGKRHGGETAEDILNDSGRLQQAIQKMFKQVLCLDRAFAYFFQDIVRIIIEDWDAKRAVKVELLDIPEPPKISEVRIPYFIRRG